MFKEDEDNEHDWQIYSFKSKRPWSGNWPSILMSNSKCLEVTEENRGIIIIDNDEPINKPQPNQEIMKMVK